MLRNSLTHDYLFETRKEAISMEMQCLHAWEKSIICHLKMLRAQCFLGFLLHIAFSVFFLVFSVYFIYFFLSCAHPEEKQMV